MRLMAKSAPPGPLVTAEALAEYGSEAKFWELWDGKIVVREPAGGLSGPVGATLTSLLLAHVRGKGLGWVCDSCIGYIVARGPDRVLSPDVSFIARGRLHAWPDEGFVAAVPNLVAEIRSPKDTWTQVAYKGGVWISHGVDVVWLIDPRKHRVTTLLPGRGPVEAVVGGTFSGAPALPDLTLRVDDLFQDL